MHKRLAKKISKIKNPKLRRSIAAQVGGLIECLCGWNDRAHDWKKWDTTCGIDIKPKARD